MKIKLKLLIVIALFMFLILLSGITYSIFNSEVAVKSDTNIAKFIFDASLTDQISLPLIDLKPGDNKEYAFSVKNSNETDISNVSVSYQIIINTYHFAPIDIKLYKVDSNSNETLVMVCDETRNRNTNSELVCNMDSQIMSHSTLSIDNYILKVNFPNTYNTIEYSNLVDFINISINSWQVVSD